MPNFESLSQIFSLDFQERYDSLPPSPPYLVTPLCTLEPDTTLIEISPGKSLYISSDLDPSQQEQLVNLSQNHLDAFAWGYEDMKGILPETCTHHIYIQDGARIIQQPQRRMNPALRDVVKEELQKLLSANFIYLISDSQWVSLLVIIPKKNVKWRVCVDYRELNKATQKDHFPLPFIDEVLDTISGKNKNKK